MSDFEVQGCSSVTERMGFAILYAARMFWRVCQLYSANHCCSQLIPGMFWTKQHGLHSCAPERASQCAADELRDVFTSLTRRARESLWSRTNFCFPASQFFLVLLFQKSVPSQSLRTCRSLQNRHYFLAFCKRARSAKKNFRLFCRLPPLQTTDTTRKRWDSEDFELFVFLKNSFDSHQQIPPFDTLVIENSNLSYLYVLMHVITIGDGCSLWFA